MTTRTFPNRYSAETSLPIQQSYVGGAHLPSTSGETFETRLRTHLRWFAANRLQAGSIWINDYNVTPPEVPFGGYKQSGVGRENGLQAIQHYTQVKTVYANLGKVPRTY